MCICICIFVYMCTYRYTCVYMCIYMHIHIYVYLYIYVYIYICICVCIYMYIWTMSRDFKDSLTLCAAGIPSLAGSITAKQIQQGNAKRIKTSSPKFSHTCLSHPWRESRVLLVSWSWLQTTAKLHHWQCWLGILPGPCSSPRENRIFFQLSWYIHIYLVFGGSWFIPRVGDKIKCNFLCFCMHVEKTLFDLVLQKYVFSVSVDVQAL